MLDANDDPATGNRIQKVHDGLFVTAAGVGGGPRVKVWDGGDAGGGTPRGAFFAYEQTFTGGVQVAVADVNGDGTPDIIAAPVASGGPHVKVFDGADLTGAMLLHDARYPVEGQRHLCPDPKAPPMS